MRRVWLMVCLTVIAAAAVVVAIAEYDRACPAFLNLETCKVAVVNARFVSDLQGVDFKIKESNVEKYRLLIVTLSLDKPEGMAVTLPCADLTLHYKRQNDAFDVAPCEGLSNFTVSKDEDRGLLCGAPNGGPGWTKVKTQGPASRAATTIYVDALFGKVESDVTNVWVCVGQPSTGHEVKGWEGF